MTRTSGRTTRWGLSAIALGALACIGYCALPLLAAGGILGGGLAVVHDLCVAPMATLLVGMGLTALGAWIRRRSIAGCCGGGGAECRCAGADAESQTLAFNDGGSSGPPAESEVHDRLLGSAP